MLSEISRDNDAACRGSGLACYDCGSMSLKKESISARLKGHEDLRLTILLLAIAARAAQKKWGGSAGWITLLVVLDLAAETAFWLTLLIFLRGVLSRRANT